VGKKSYIKDDYREPNILLLKNGMEGVISTMIYLRYCKNFYKCHSVPPASTTIIKNGSKITCLGGVAEYEKDLQLP
jgi:hypothetical protein